MNFILLILFVSLNVFADKDADEYKGQYTCFKANLIQVSADYERVRWPGSKYNNVCSLSLNIYSIKPAHFYFTRSWRDPSYCKKFTKDWAGLRKQNKKVCIAADQVSLHKIKRNGIEILEQSGYLEIIRSRKWCHSYFDRDNCN